MKTNRSKKLLGLTKDIFAYGIMEGISRLTSVLLLPIFTRVFATDEYGIIDILATLTSLVTIFIRLSLPSAISRYIYSFDTKEEQSRLVSTLLSFVTVVGLVTVFLGVLLAKPLAQLLLGSSDLVLFIILGFASAYFIALASIPQMVLRMERRIIQFNLLNILYSISYAGIALYLVFVHSTGIFGVLLGLVLASILKFILAVILTRSYLTKQLSYGLLRRSLSYSLPLLPAVLVTWVNAQSNRLLILTFVGLSGVGIYGAAARLGTIINLIGTIFRQAWSPYAMTLLRQPAEERDQFYRQILNYYSGGFACIGLAFAAISPDIMRIFVPEQYYEGYVIIPWIIGASILHSSASITNIGILVEEKTFATSIAAWSGAILNVILSLVLISFFGLRGAAIGTFTAELAFTGLMWYFSVHYSSVRFDTRAVITVLATYIIASILFIWTAEVILNPIYSLSARLAIMLLALLLIGRQTIDKSLLSTFRYALNELIARIKLSRKKITT